MLFFSRSFLFGFVVFLTLAGCGGGGGSNSTGGGSTGLNVTASAGSNGSISPGSAAVNSGETTTFTVTPDTGFAASASGCGGSLSGNTYTTGAITADCTVTATFSAIGSTSFNVTASAGSNGSISPGSAAVNSGETTTFTVTPDTGFAASASGCGGSLSGNTYTTGAITADCTVTATFSAIGSTGFNVTATAGTGTRGSISPASVTVNSGETATFSITPNEGYSISVLGTCGGTLNGTTFTTNVVTEDCSVMAIFVFTAASTPALSFSPVKAFHFSWTDTPAATHYRLLENPDGVSGFSQVGGDIPQGSESVDHLVSLYQRINAQYILKTCSGFACNDSDIVSVSSTMVGSIGYIKASNTGAVDLFGEAVSISSDGNTLAVGAWRESSNATGVNGDQSDNSAVDSGAVYVFTRSGTVWSQQAYIKASNSGGADQFGYAVSISSDGNTLAVGAWRENSNATGVNGDQSDNSAADSGAVYVFTRSGTVWSQQAYIKASNTGGGDGFGHAVSISGDGSTLAVGARDESSNATGVNGDQSDNSAVDSGAAYLFTRSGTVWSQQAYLKASHTDAGDRFGYAVSISGDGNTLAVGALFESSNAIGIDRYGGDNSARSAGAAYVFTRSGTVWSQQAYIKASNAEPFDQFGVSVGLNGDGGTLAVGAWRESSNATGVNGDQSDNSTADSSAVYVFTRSGTVWSQQAYLKASNTDVRDVFGHAVSISGDGSTLAVGAIGESSNATGVNGDQLDNSAGRAGAVYVFTRSGTVWSQQAYLKASNTGGGVFQGDGFGESVSLNGDGSTLAVGAPNESSNATGVNGNQSDNSLSSAGAVYLY